MIPISTSLKPKSTPYANYMLIALNVIVFLMSSYLFEKPKMFDRQSGRVVVETLKPEAQQFMLKPDRPFIWQFITYAFLHSGWMHIIGNMYFLFMFGNNVNDRLGNVGYLCFYLAGAAFSGIGHALFSSTPVVGASGAVAAVTGAYLVLFPNTLITVAYMFFYIWDTLEIKALYFIALKLIFWDNIFEPRLAPQAIAYGAHLAGYVFGVACILILLAVRLIDAGHDSLWAMLRQWNRRRTCRDVVSEDYNPFEDKRAQSVSTAEPQTAEPHALEISALREQISTALASRNLSLAAKSYIELLKLNPETILSQQNQLDLANTLMSDNQWEWAALAYENYLAKYGQSSSQQVQLMLGLLYTRYIHKPQRAKEVLGQALGKLTVTSQIRMCEDLLAELG